MSSRAASCPSCGNGVLFSAGSSLVTVCASCRSAVSRKGVDLASLGKVAELVPTSSPLHLGLRGKPKKGGYKPFSIIGRLQLSTGKGTWDEWHVLFEDGKYGWIAEAQGAFYVMRPMPAPSATVPEFAQISPNQKLPLPPYGTFTVTDRRQALYVSAEGELPFSSPPGAVFMYADLSGEDGSFATLDYGDDPGLDAFFVGRPAELADLGIEGITGFADRKVAARAQALNCPNCGGPLALKDPLATVRIACSYCGSLLGEDDKDPGKFEVLVRLKKLEWKPRLPLGLVGTLNGGTYVILGAMLKKCEVEGLFYFWTEYLLKETKTEAYHWLVESNGHWSLVRPIAAGLVTDTGGGAVVQGQAYKHFQSTTAVVEGVLGEFYWQVEFGERTGVSDYVAPPRVLSQETSGHEVNWSEGVYVPKVDVETAFTLKQPLPDAEGIGSNQPWPRAEEARQARKVYRVLLAVAVAVFLFMQVSAPREVVYQQRLDVPPQAATTDAEHEAQTVLSEPFELKGSGNVEIGLAAPTDNSWIAVGATLIDQTTGETRSVALQSDYYHGYDGGESWSEGSRSREAFLSRVPKGTYVLRLEPQFESGKAPAYYDVRVRRGVPRVYRFIWVLILLSLGPLYYGFSYLAFEQRRWAESDHAGGGDEES